jgi:uncharacterized peroxidase-related enzyme
MPRIQPVEPHDAPQVSQEYVEAGKQMTGGEVINYFKQMSVSPASFKGYMDLSETLQDGSLDRKLQESIAVAVSDFNGCTYCLSVHSGLAEQEGLSEDEREQAQQFESEDPKRAAALHFVREVVESRGHPSDEVLDEVREAGYTDEQIMEMISNVALNTLSNYMNETIETEVDVPVVETTHSR